MQDHSGRLRAAADLLGPDFLADSSIHPGRRLAAVRGLAGLRQAEAAVVVHVSQGKWSELERGETVPTVASAAAIMRAAGIPAGAWVRGSEPPRSATTLDEMHDLCVPLATLMRNPDVYPGDRLRCARALSGVSQVALGAMLGLSAGAVPRWETGAWYGNGPGEAAQALSYATGIPADAWET